MKPILRQRLSRLSILFAVALLFGFAVALLPYSVAAQGGEADVWVLHLAPFADTLPGTAVDVEIMTAGGTATLPSVEYKEGTEAYLPIPAGQVDVTIYPAGSTTPVLEETLNVTTDTQYTVAAIGGAMGWPVELLALEDDNTPPAAASGKVRIVHLAPFADTAPGTAVDLRLQNGVLLPGFGGIEYKDVSQYLTLPATTLDLIITAPGGSPILLDIPPFEIEAATVTTVYAIGDTVNQPLEVYAQLTYPLAPPTAVTLNELSSGAEGSYSWLLALGIAAVGAAALYRRRVA